MAAAMLSAQAADGWKPADNPLMTGWGKQFMYTRSSGIWQTVWLEAVPQTSSEGIKITPDVDAGFIPS